MIPTVFRCDIPDLLIGFDEITPESIALQQAVVAWFENQFVTQIDRAVMYENATPEGGGGEV